MEERVTGSVQVSKDHYENHYDTAERWSSYWNQIQEILPFTSGSVLEIGVGNGVVASYLRTVARAKVVTVDIDKDLNPDVVADIVQLPFEDNEFECCVACQVLEHLPYPETERALVELRRVAKMAVISVPNSSFSAGVSVRVGFRFRLDRLVPLGRIRKRSSVGVEDQHYWELGVKEYSTARFRRSIQQAGWRIDKEYRNILNPYHHFFILS